MTIDKSKIQTVPIYRYRSDKCTDEGFSSVILFILKSNHINPLTYSKYLCNIKLLQYTYSKLSQYVHISAFICCPIGETSDFHQMMFHKREEQLM